MDKTKPILRVIVVSTHVLGLASLLLFILFLYYGPLRLVQMGFNQGTALLWDCLLSLVFFVQHSGMIRRGFRYHLSNVISPLYHGAFYTIVSGVVLAALAVFWQGTHVTLYELQGPTRQLVRGIFFITTVGIFWAIFSIRAFDIFGVAPIRAKLDGAQIRPQAFIVRGPYLWVRHPLYLLVIMTVWSCPDLTLDRFILNVLLTIWMCVGAVLEEADLVADFGDQYRDYQNRVPMLIPWRGRAG
jgi:methanethiol S-methyltransferase